MKMPNVVPHISCSTKVFIFWKADFNTKINTKFNTKMHFISSMWSPFPMSDDKSVPKCQLVTLSVFTCS